MNLGRRKYTVTFVVVWLCFFSQAAFSVYFEPGVGVGVEYTDNATLVKENKVNELITVGYVGARLSENEGALTYAATAALNNTRYTQDAFVDQQFFRLGANADWEMVKERFDWFLSNYFNQRKVVALNSNTPDNLQDSNVFTFGANIRFPISARQNFSITPMFRKYYVEILLTDNKQNSLLASWKYQISHLTNVGFNLSVREIDYTEKNLLGQPIVDVTFTNASVFIGGQRLRSNFSINLGATNVKRDNGQEATGFAGNFNWSLYLSSRSRFETQASSDLTDTSSVVFSEVDDPANGGGNVQNTTGIIRNSIINLAYLREDASLSTRIWARYHKVKYSDKPLDRVIRSFGLQVDHPVSQLLSSGAYLRYSPTKERDTGRRDEQFIVGGYLRYKFSHKLRGFLDLKYRKKQSTFEPENFGEYSAFVSLVYGFGNVGRPTRTGGF